MDKKTKQIVIKNAGDSDVMQFKADNMTAAEQNYMLTFALVAHAHKFGYSKEQVSEGIDQIWSAFEDDSINTKTFPLDS